MVNSDDRTFSINRKRKKMARDGKGRDEGRKNILRIIFLSEKKMFSLSACVSIINQIGIVRSPFG